MTKEKKTKKVEKNITHYTYDTTAFHGYRVNKIFLGQQFCKYYSVKDFLTEEKALSAAQRGLKALNRVVENASLKNGKLTPTTIKEANEALIIKKPKGKK